MIKSYKVLRDRELRGELCAKEGDTVFRAKGYDYGLASDDTRWTGKEHISVTLYSNGDGPSFTIACEDIEESEGSAA